MSYGNEGQLLGNDIPNCYVSDVKMLLQWTKGMTLQREDKRLWWSRGSVLPLSTQVCGFKPGRSRQDFPGRKNTQHTFLQRGSKAVGPML